VKTQELVYTAGKVRAVGYLAWDETLKDRRPGVVVFPEAFGLNDHARERADRLARLGYVALAADVNGDGAVYHDMAQLRPVIGGLYGDRAEWRARARAAEDEGRLHAKVLVCHGDKDPIVTKEGIDTFLAELRRDNVDWQFTYHGKAAHSFTDPTADQRNSPAFAYSKLAEDRSWAAMRHLFEEVFG
jgi:dienelactone hydrolase